MQEPQMSLKPPVTNAGQATPDKGDAASAATGETFSVAAPSISLPKGGGSIHGIGEKFSSNPVTGTGSMSVPIPLSAGRGGVDPQLALTYDSGTGQGVFGLGWQLRLPMITRKTDKGLPRYLDGDESDVFLLSGAEDLVPQLDAIGNRMIEPTRLAGIDYNVFLYRPRIEGLFARIERWTSTASGSGSFWRTITRDNVTTWYGRDASTCIADANDGTHICQWLICQTCDDKGNVAVYDYVDDQGSDVDTTAIWEANRDAAVFKVNRYLKRIRYGNVSSFIPTLDAEVADPLPDTWLFEAVLDYGDHAGAFPTPTPDVAPWPARSDPFSSHRSGFEIRTYRLCNRVLMFHHFPGAAAVGNNCLVRATEFQYDASGGASGASPGGYVTLQSVTQRAYQKTPLGPGPYATRAFPPVSFDYSQPVVDQTVRSIGADQLDNLPIGTQGAGYRWLDLDGEGLSGVLAEQGGAWFYKSNLGDASFGPMRQVSPQPAVALVAGGRRQFMDLSGGGEIDVVDFGDPAPGFYQRDGNTGWKRHLPFANLPNINWQDPQLRFVDLTGDGHADALITEQEVFTWYPSLGEQGFDAAERTPKALDEDSGPRLVFSDGTQTIFLADMSGDGLTDFVRVRNGEVCYWPNQGYGRFGRKVTLGNSPRFDHPEFYDPNRIRLADIDGSGPVDVIYLGRDGARLYFNRSGNALSDPTTVELPVATENLQAVQLADLLGNGTACLVWNSHLPGDAGHPVCYIDLMGGSAETPAEHRSHEKRFCRSKVGEPHGGGAHRVYRVARL